MPTKHSPKGGRRVHRPAAKSTRKGKGTLPLLLGIAALVLCLLFVWVKVIPALRSRLEQPSTQGETLSSQVYMLIHPYCPYDEENFIDNPDGTLSYEDENFTSLAGIDVSSHQGEIDWAAVAEDGISFAMIRLGWRGYSVGDLCQDELAMTNLQQAKENGISVGAYFYSQAITPEEAQAEAELALAVLDGFSLDLPVYFDWELDTRSGSRSASMDHTSLTQCAKAFCTTIEGGGYQAGIYFYRSLGEDTYDLTELADFDFWLSQPADRPTFSHTYTLWQYTYEGTVDGISTSVDRDLMFVPKTAEEETSAAEPTPSS